MTLAVSIVFIGVHRAVIAAIQANVVQLMANKVLQKTKTAVANFGIVLSHNGLLLACGFVARRQGRCWLLSTGVRPTT